MELEFSGGQIFEKSSHIKFNANPFRGSRTVLCGRSDMTKLLVAFRNFANEPKTQSRILTHIVTGAGLPLDTRYTCLHYARESNTQPPVACSRFVVYEVIAFW